MTKEGFEVIANTLKKLGGDKEMVNAFVKALTKAYPNFDSAKFRMAIGIPTVGSITVAFGEPIPVKELSRPRIVRPTLG